eukprot:gene28391-37478_t
MEGVQRRNPNRIALHRGEYGWKLFIAIAVLALAGACGYIVYTQIFSFEYILYNASYDATTLQIHTSLDDGLSYNYLATQDLAYAVGILCPFASIWPNCSIKSANFNNLVTPLVKIGLLRDMSLVPLIPNPPAGVAAFESFAYKVFSTDPGYNPTSGISPFGKGIYSKYLNGTRYHDTTGKTAFSPNNILCPILAFGDNFANKNALMFNLHSESNRAATLDRLIAKFNAGNRNASTVTKLLQLVQDTNGLRPASLMMFPIAPAYDSSTLVGFISIIQNWDTVIGKAVPSHTTGIDFVLSDGVKFFTFTTLSDGTVGLIGSGGDLHDRNFDSYRKSYFPFKNKGYSDYSIVFYPNASYFPAFLKVGPIIGCVAVMVLILLLACLFGSYDQYKDRQLQSKQDALDNKRLFVRFISHEIRTPLNTVCLGLRLLKDEATATAGTVGKGRATNSEANVFDLEEGLGAGENESSSLLPAPTLALVKPNPVVLEKKKLLGWVDIIKDIEESSHNAVEVLNELMSYDKIEMKTLKIEMELVPMWAFVNATIKPFYVQAKEKCIKLTLQVDPSSLSGASEE